MNQLCLALTQLVYTRIQTQMSDGGGLTTGGSAGHEVPGPSVCYTPPHRKRARDEDVVRSSPHRRRRLDTPTKHAIGCLQPVASPLVAVCDTSILR